MTRTQPAVALTHTAAGHFGWFQRSFSIRPVIFALFLIAGAACSTGPANDSSDANRRGNANAAGAADPTKPLPAEPDRYILTMVLGGVAPKIDQTPPPPSSNSANKSVRRPASAPTAPHGWSSGSENEFVLSKAGNDRKWVFQIPGLGDVAYLEKSGLKYLVLATRGLYTEVTPAELGFDAQAQLNPTLIVNQMIPRFRSERVGPELVVNRLGTKFRFSDEGASGKSDRPITCAISLDQETRLPIRFEMDSPKSVIEARDLRLNIDLSQFDVPIGMKKVNSDTLKAQIQTFSKGVQPFIRALNIEQPGQPQGIEPSASERAPAANRAATSGASSNRAAGSTGPANPRKSPVNSNRKPIRST